MNESGDRETIFALASAPGRAAVAVIRISGPAAGEALTSLCGTTLRAREARYVAFRDPTSRELLDRGVALWFPGPQSATGEDCAECQIHGGRAVVDAFLSSLASLPDLRPAQAGEFLRRSFANGKQDLSQIEGLADLIDAQTQAQRRIALRVGDGALRERVESWRGALIEALASVEAELDFSDEGDVDTQTSLRLEALLTAPLAQMRRALAAAPLIERMRDGFTILILGPPNAGKSTLMNALARREIAIVSPSPGTTRDLIEAHLDVGGFPVTLIDSAGLRDAQDEVERIGVDRARRRVESADLLLWLAEGGETPPPADLAPQATLLMVSTKSDLFEKPAQGWIAISSRDDASIDRLVDRLQDYVSEGFAGAHDAVLLRSRHRLAVSEASEALARALECSATLELIAEELRLAARALGRITGRIDVEDVLDSIFSRFCIGK